MASLDGLHVLDLSRLLPGPLCTMILGDLGADVVKVEQPEIGDYARFAPPLIGDTGSAFLMLNRNKRSITLNLKNAEAKEILHKLATKADVFVESYQPGVAERLGVGYPAIRKVNEHIIYCSISGYGQTGPYRDFVGHDLNYAAYSGAIGATGLKGGPPVIPAVQIADIQSAIYAAVAITAALYRREKTGEAEFIDVSMMDTAIASMIMPLSFHFAGASTERGESFLSGGAPFYNVYETKDRKFISIASLEPKFWAELCNALGVEEYQDQQIVSAEVSQQISAALAEKFREKKRDEWVKILNEREIPCAPVYDVSEVPADPQVRAREMIFEMETEAFGKLNQLATPIRISHNPLVVRSGPPKLGQHTLEILRELGYSTKDVERLKTEGAI
ncbi:MAG: CaiB/BaiF CoA-transferase family protein [Candidatus Bathyarchaeia archaeon]